MPVLRFNPARLANQNSLLLKRSLILLALLPSIRLLWEFLSDSLGINGFERLIHSTGEWALIFLLLIYAVSPLRRWCSRGMIALAADYGHRLSDWNWLMGLRRALGLLAFFYASSHFLIYFWLELGFSLEEVGYELQERPFIAAGFTSLILLLPLAITSSNAMMRRLKHNWQQLHQLVHLAVIASLLHYLWLSKAGDPAIKFYLLAGGILLLERLAVRLGLLRAAPSETISEQPSAGTSA